MVLWAYVLKVPNQPNKMLIYLHTIRAGYNNSANITRNIFAYTVFFSYLFLSFFS